MAQITITEDYVVNQNYVNTALDTNLFSVSSLSGITFTNNNYRLYGGGGSGGNSNGVDGANSLINNNTSIINTLINYGIMNGGGGSGGYAGGDGGVGGGGGGGFYGSVGVSGDAGGSGGNGGNSDGGGGGGFGSAGGNASGGIGPGGLGGLGGPGVGGYTGGIGSFGGGGGSSGGGNNGGGGSFNAGKGGYGIVNNGTIITLINRQGVSQEEISIGGLNVYTIPLYISGNLPQNYQISIDDTTGRYGQLYGKNVSGGPINISIDPTSVIDLNIIGESKIYTNILNGITPQNTSGFQIIDDKNYTWVIESDNMTITLQDIVCYNEDTSILVEKDGIEQYIPINELTPGIKVKTYLRGYKKLKYLLNTQVFSDGGENISSSMYCIKKTDKMTHDLIISGQHLILIDEKEKINYEEEQVKFKIDDKYCINAYNYKNSELIKENKIFNIYHLILEGKKERYGVYVNGGFISESTSEKILKEKIGYFKIIH